MRKIQERREAALWRLERDLRDLQVKVLAQNGGASRYQTLDMERMEEEIKVLKTRLGKAI